MAIFWDLGDKRSVAVVQDSGGKNTQERPAADTNEGGILIAMSQRLQVLLDEEELQQIREIARQQRVTVAEWVRQALRAARRRQPRTCVEQKLAALESAAGYAFPTGDIDTMLDEVARGRALS